MVQERAEVRKGQQLIRGVLLAGAAVLSYWIGYEVYKGLLVSYWGEGIVERDRQSILYWTGMSHLFIGVPFYLLIGTIVHRKAGGPAADIVWTTVLCGLFFLLPAACIALLFAGLFPIFFTLEASLFYCQFAAEGLSFGLLSALIRRMPLRSRQA
ncbi:hypothetical protein J31TS4_23910 [Paenibacillus sp. J31TS4]|uniref:hypothetical protein n=1 Tax=Paenibacillus sp. J31TS4 TaxID=2807195 RepID=UPI001B1E0669|nr:hypothetical protein [Paenibacillus sp. J31TS4]GIP39111.1 hypothetical protein J31TS4_23910 [Paenibacillus sp. J31TS4]